MKQCLTQSDIMYSSMNQSKVMGAVFLNVTKAFNCIDHEVLLKKRKM